MRNKAKEIKSDREHENIYRRISQLTTAMRQIMRVLEECEELSECSKKRLQDISREIY